MYNLIEYNDNYSHSSESLWQFKRDEIATNANVWNANSSWFKYKSSLIGNSVADRANGKNKFWRSLESPSLNCKVELSLSWIENCVLSGWENIDDAGAVANAGTAATFKITDSKLYVSVVT